VLLRESGVCNLEDIFQKKIFGRSIKPFEFSIWRQKVDFSNIDFNKKKDFYQNTKIIGDVICIKKVPTV
jgi:hypothetical protein